MPDANSLIAEMEQRAADLGRLGYRVRFDLTDTEESILLDAAGPGPARLGPAGEEEAADTVLRLSTADLQKLIAGRLSPMLAFSTGRLRVEGSKGVALKLASLLDEG
jgi:ubiquinone biosynthesis protein UbiJ